MFLYAIRRLLGGMMTLGVLMGLTFSLLRLAPGGPFDSDRAWPPEIQANLLRQYGLDQPVWIQFVQWSQGLFRGDLKESLQYLGHPVRRIISDSLPISMLLGCCALSLAVLFGIPVGAFAARKAGTGLNEPRRSQHRFWNFSFWLAVSGISIPNYLVASLLILIFSLWLRWLPPALWESPASMVLPVLTLAWRPLGIIARMTCTSMDEVLGADYIRTAYGKGLSDQTVILKHALKNSLIPVVTLLGPLAANLITGSFLVEVVFQIPGLGKHFVQAVLNRDYPLVMGVTLVYGIILILTNLTVDLLCGWVDPRIRMGET